MKKTAIEFLLDNLIICGVFDLDKSQIDIIKQAKEMEKEQIKNAYLIPYDFHYYVEFEQYYNETFKSE